MNTPTLLTAADLAEVFGKSERTVMEWQRIYDWPHVKVGRTFRWTAEQVEQIVASHTETGKAAPALTGQTARSAARRRSA